MSVKKTYRTHMIRLILILIAYLNIILCINSCTSYSNLCRFLAMRSYIFGSLLQMDRLLMKSCHHNDYIRLGVFNIIYKHVSILYLIGHRSDSCSRRLFSSGCVRRGQPQASWGNRSQPGDWLLYGCWVWWVESGTGWYHSASK